MGCIVATMTTDHIAFLLNFVPLLHLLFPLFVALLTSLPALWHEEHPCNFSVFKGIHMSNLVRIASTENTTST
jgi:hypothetical protein